MRRLRIIVLSLCGVIAAAVAAINPLNMTLLLTTIAAIVVMFSMLNISRFTILLKQLTQTLNQIRTKVRANIRMGFRDYSGVAVEDEERSLRNSHCGYMR
jgi:hypothetical protein